MKQKMRTNLHNFLMKSREAANTQENLTFQELQRQQMKNAVEFAALVQSRQTSPLVKDKDTLAHEENF